MIRPLENIVHSMVKSMTEALLRHFNKFMDSQKSESLIKILLPKIYHTNRRLTKTYFNRDGKLTSCITKQLKNNLSKRMPPCLISTLSYNRKTKSKSLSCKCMIQISKAIWGRVTITTLRKHQSKSSF